ncbi:MAG: T9SS type A sorting domain-containing protein [Bacteroidales bacterium]|nr:T9SS type A sorting domain-containing protein [Bacteroidales bacterium]
MKKGIMLLIVCTMFVCTYAQEVKEKPLAHFNLLLVIKPEFNLPQFDLVGTTLSSDKIEAITRSYLVHLPDLCSRISDSMVVLSTKVVVSPYAISQHHGDANDFLLYPEDVIEDIQQFSSPGEFDCIQFIYNLDGKVNANAWGLTYPSFCFTSQMNYAGYCTIVDINSASDYANADHTVHEVFLHEWMHTLEQYYYNLLGVTRIPGGGLDGAGGLGYTSDTYGRGEDETRFFKGLELFYRDHLLGTMYNYNEHSDMPGTGFGPAAYAYPTPREVYSQLTNAFWKPAESTRANNLLQNPSFEEITPDSLPVSWVADNRWFADHQHSWTTVSGTCTHGNRALYISATEDVVFAVKQELVLENEAYILTFKIKTNQVEAHEGGHNFGAGMQTWDNHPDGYWYSNGPAFEGTQDWQRGGKLFKPNPEYPTTTIAAAIGNWSSAATGAAWFDDIILVKIKDFKGSIDSSTTAINSILPDKSGNLKIYPNPAKNELKIENGEWKTGNKIEIYDLLGKLQQSSISNQQSSIQTIDISHLSTGMYLLRVLTPAGTIIKKFVKE